MNNGNINNKNISITERRNSIPTGRALKITCLQKATFGSQGISLEPWKQEPGDTVDSFVKKIRFLMEECLFTSPDEHIIDALIWLYFQA